MIRRNDNNTPRDSLFPAADDPQTDTEFILTRRIKKNSWKLTSHAYYVCENINFYYNKIYL